MNLLQLPAELVRSILYVMDPTSFYMCMLTNKVFREHALSSADLLLTQINSLPGTEMRISDGIGASELIKIFTWRATHHLSHGASWMADVQSWHLSNKTTRNNSVILKWDKLESKKFSRPNRLAFVHLQDDASVHVYMITRCGSSRSREPCLKYIILPDFRTPQSQIYQHPFDGHCAVEVLRVAAYSPRHGEYIRYPHIAVLYRVTKRRGNSTEISSWRKINCYRLEEFGHVMVETLDPEGLYPLSAEVLSMAVSPDGVVVVLSHGTSGYGIEFYWKSKDGHNNDCFASGFTATTYGNGDFFESLRHSDRLGSISILGNDVVFDPVTIPMPQWTILNALGRLSRPAGAYDPLSIFPRRTHLPSTYEMFVGPLIGRPIAREHYCKIRNDSLNDGEETCVNALLEFIISRDDMDRHAADRHGPGRSGAFILKSFAYPDDCREIEFNTQTMGFDHIYVAELVGVPDLTNISTIGLKVAISPSAHHIAIASWKTVKVWALEPGAFLNPDVGLRGGKFDLPPDDPVYTRCCGWQYYRNQWSVQDGVGVLLLEPVELPCSSVVYGLEFVDEFELWAWCDDGVVKWSFGAGATGKRSVSMLSC